MGVKCIRCLRFFFRAIWVRRINVQKLPCKLPHVLDVLGKLQGVFARRALRNDQPLERYLAAEPVFEGFMQALRVLAGVFGYIAKHQPIVGVLVVCALPAVLLNGDFYAPAF